MAKNQLNMKSIKNTKKDIQQTVKNANETLLDFSEDVIKETVKTGEAWQKLMAKAVKNSEPLMSKQSDILFETVKGMKAEAEYSVKRIEKLTGLDFTDIRKTFDIKVPTAPKWIKDGFEYVTDQTEEILSEVSKRGEEIVETVTDTAKTFAKEAGQMKGKVENKVKEVIKEVETRITDISPKASAAKTAKKKAPKSAASKSATTKTTAPKASTKKTVKKVASVKVEATKKETPKSVAPKKTQTAKVEVKKVTVASKADDLKIIEGVGPKLEELLINGGFKSYADIAKAEVTDLQKVLDAAGSRYQMHNPTSWPLQARFARDGKLEALKSWQEKNNAQKA